MPRRQRPPETNHRERWLVSYADILTLLFAFFTMLYAISATDVVKAERLSRSLRESFGEDLLEVPVQPSDEPTILDGEIPQPQLEDQAGAEAARTADQKRLDILGTRVEELTQGEKEVPGISVRRTEEGLVISLAESVLFDRGGADLADPAKGALADVAGLLKGVPNHVRVEGHTDDSPVRGAQQESNWALSAARAVAIIHVLTSEGIAPLRLSASGFADQRPLMSNETPEGRRANRRVDLVVLRARTAQGDP